MRFRTLSLASLAAAAIAIAAPAAAQTQLPDGPGKDLTVKLCGTCHPADRGASVRVPHSFVNGGYKGYLEDRRPNSAADPYLVAGRIIKTIQTVPTS